MKQLVFVMTAFVGMTFVACDGTQNGNCCVDTLAVDSAVVDTADTVAVDSAVVDTVDVCLD